MSVASLSRHLLTVQDYYKMAEAGILDDDDRVELIAGELIDMSPMGPRHAGTGDLLEELLREALVGEAIIRSQKPLYLDEYTELEPDILVARRLDDHYRSRHPGARDVYLLVEISDSSLAKDREVKLPLYARHGIAEVWLVNLVDEQVEIYHDPQPERERFARVIPQTQGHIAPLRFPQARIELEELF